MLSLSAIRASINESLKKAGYTEVNLADDLRLFEDQFGVVAVCEFETWSALKEGWAAAQGRFSELVGKAIGRGEPKAWDAYLVLVTPTPIPSGDREVAASIRYDVARTRKLLITGDQALTTGELEEALLPLLPLTEIQAADADPDILGELPRVLSKFDVPQTEASTVVDAFKRQRPLLEALHSLRGGS